MEAGRLRFKPGGLALAVLVGALLVYYAWMSSVQALWLAAALSVVAVASAATAKSAASILAGSTVERWMEPRESGAIVRVTVRVRAPRGIPPSRLRLQENPPSHVVLAGKPGYSISIFHGAVEWAYKAYTLPGKWCWDPPTVTVEDLLGLFEASVTVGGRLCTRIPPRLRRVSRLVLEEAGVIGGKTPIGRGVGTAFLYVRDYTSDDDPRFIEWKATARTGRLAVKVFEREEFASVTMILALSPGSLQALPGATPYEAAVGAAALLGQALVDAGADVSLVVCSGGPPQVTLRVNTIHELASALSSIEPPLDWGGWRRCVNTLEAELARASRRGRRRIAVVLGDPEGVDTVSAVAGKHWIVVSKAFTGGESPVDAAARLAGKAARLAWRAA